MCWTEHTIRRYGCNATTPIVAFAGVQTHNVSTTARRKCQHMITMEGLYNDYLQTKMATDPQANAQNLPDISLWARRSAWSGYVLCIRSTYWANWSSTRHCRSDGLHGSSTCLRVGTVHTYPGATSS